jgi:titin
LQLQLSADACFDPRSVFTLNLDASLGTIMLASNDVIPHLKTKGAMSAPLVVGQKCYIRIWAVNQAGTSLWPTFPCGEGLDGIVPSAASPPNAPSVARGVDKSLTTLTIAWEPPTDDGGLSVLAYRVAQASHANPKWTLSQVDSIAMPPNKLVTAVIRGLECGLRYRFIVCAANHVAIGPWGEPSAPIATATTVPTQPSQPVVVALLDATTVKLSWPPPSFTGGAALTGYDIEATIVSQRGSLSKGWQKVKKHPHSAQGVEETEIGELQPASFYQFRLLAININGASLPSEPSVAFKTGNSVPGAPNPPVIILWLLHSLTVSWEPPDGDGGEPITEYELQQCEAPLDNWTTVHVTAAATENTTCIEGLQSGVLYQFRIRGKNSYGSGVWSRPSDATQTSTAEPSQAGCPLVDEATISNGALELSWEPPTEFGGLPLIGYDVEQALFPDGCTWEAAAVSFVDDKDLTEKGVAGDRHGAGESAQEPQQPSVKRKLYALWPGRSYQFRVRAFNSKGSAEWSRASNPVLLPKAAPWAPAAPRGTINPRCLSQVIVEWLAPDADGGEPTSSYVLQRSRLSDTEPCWTSLGTILHPSDHRPRAQVDISEPGSLQVFRVAAVTIIGQGEFSGASAPVQMPPAPPIMHDEPPEAVSIGMESVELTWKAPSVLNGAHIICYRIQYAQYPDEAPWHDGCEVTETNAQNSQVATVSGLIPGRSYIFRICAVNAAGESPWGRRSAVVTTLPAPPGQPDPPEMIESGPFHFVLKWNPPAFDGGSPILHYIIRRIDETHGKESVLFESSSPHPRASLGNLLAGTLYRLCVAAVNDVGQGPWSDLTEPVETVSSVPTVPAPPRVFTSLHVVDKVVTAALSKLRASLASMARASIEWDPPTNTGGPPITGYKVEHCCVDDEQSKLTWLPSAFLFHTVGQDDQVVYAQSLRELEAIKVAEGTSEALPDAIRATVGGLAFGAKFQFRVSALNSCGGSAMSDASPILCTDTTLPAPPPQPSVNKNGITSSGLTVVVVAPLHMGGLPLKHYELQGTVGSGSSKWFMITHVESKPDQDTEPSSDDLEAIVWDDGTSAETRSTMLRVERLWPGESYVFRLRAVTSNGVSDWSKPSEAIRTLPSVPTAPPPPQAVNPNPEPYLFCSPLFLRASL